MIGWRTFHVHGTGTGAMLAGPLAAELGLADEYWLFPDRGSELRAKCPKPGHIPPEPGCGCGLYYFPGPLPVEMLYSRLLTPAVAEVDVHGPVSADPMVDKHRAGIPQRAASLRLRRIWVAPDAMGSGLIRYHVAVTPWRLVNGRPVIDLQETAA